MKVELPINSKTKERLARMEDGVDKVSDEEAVECYYTLISYCTVRKCKSCLFGGGGSGCRINGPASWESSQGV